MCKCGMIVVLLVCLTIKSVTCTPYLRGYNMRYTREVFNEAATILPLFRPQLPKVVADPKCAENSTFCESIDSYPYIHLKFMLERNPAYNDIFSKESREEAKEDLENRQGPDGTFICRSVSRTVFPKIGKNKNNKWKFIVNQDNFLQGVRVETCTNPDYPCDLIDNFPRDYVTFCRQKYLYTRLLSLNDGGHPAPDTFKLPSACCCAYKRTDFLLKQFKDLVSPIRFTPKP